MPSKVKTLSFRIPWLRKLFGEDANQVAKQVLNHPSIRNRVEDGICPMCLKAFEDCDYFKSLDEY